MAILCSLKDARPPTYPTGDLNYLIRPFSIYRKLVAAMWAVLGYVELHVHLG
jgi:hypothetical protein